MPKQVFITGGSGLLALNWAQTMRRHFELTLGLHNREILLEGTNSKKINLECLDEILKTFERLKIQVVINTAGMTNVDKCEAEPTIASKINTDLASNIAKACSILGIQLVQISTDHLFSGRESLLTEDHPVSPINIYAKTKYEAECMVRENNPSALVIRTNFYGWGTSYRASFSDFVINNLRSGNAIKLYEDIFYTPIVIESAVKAIHDLIGLKSDGIFNITGNDRLSKYEFGVKIAEKFDLDHGLITAVKYDKNVSGARRPKDMSLSNRKICNLLGRNLGGVNEHLNQLLMQEDKGYSNELRRI